MRTSLPVSCDGCGQPTPYEAEGADGDPATSYLEALCTPLGRCFIRTHRRRECVAAAREAKEGRPVAWVTKQERLEDAAKGEG